MGVEKAYVKNHGLCLHHAAVHAYLWKNFMRMRYESISHVLAEIVYYGVRLTRCLDSDWSSHEYGLKIQGVYITH